MTRDDILRMAREAGFHAWYTQPEEHPDHVAIIERFAALVAAAERKLIMDSLQKQADLATDALDRRWALEMIAAVAARGETK